MDIFWRVHWSDCPPFSAKNASSAPWEDESRYCDKCRGSGRLIKIISLKPCPRHGHLPGFFIPEARDCECRGYGKVLDEIEDRGTCKACRGTGLNPRYRRVRGYSCCTSAESLVRYFEARGGAADDELVVVFAGKIVGWGPDNEPLVVPTDRPRPRFLRYGDVLQAVIRRLEARNK